MLKNNKRSLQVTAIAITVTLLLVGASGHVAAKAKKITINHKKMTLAIGQKRALKVKNTKKKAYSHRFLKCLRRCSTLSCLS